MSEPQGEPSGPFARARALLQGQTARGIEALPEAAGLLRPIAPELASLLAFQTIYTRKPKENDR